MQPIASIDPEQCKRLVGVVFDVDDTLTRHGRVEEAAYSALWKLKAAGLRLISVTGRPLGFAELMARMWPVDLAVGENGAGYVRVTETQVIHGFMEDESTRAYARELLARIVARAARELPWAKLSDDSWARRCDVAFDIGERVHIDEARIATLMKLIEEEGARVVVSSVHAHAAIGDCDKARGVVHACRVELGEDLDAQRERWLFVGDSGNDAAAFAYFPSSVGVANVRDHLAKLPVAPRFVSEADRGLGFAEIVNTVLARRGS
jgi:HAD superfamily hydrolase (TIGR01484 family)